MGGNQSTPRNPANNGGGAPEPRRAPANNPPAAANRVPELINDAPAAPVAVVRPPINYGIRWDDAGVIGLEEAKRSLDASYMLPRKFPTFCTGMKPTKTIMLWGPPGTGKTHLAQGFARGAGMELISFEPAKIQSKYVGEAEKKVAEFFDRAKERPTVLFIDEIDAFLRTRRSEERDHERALKVQFMQSLQEFINSPETNDSVIIACTNTFSDLDMAVQRRFQHKIFCKLPDAEDRLQLLKLYIPTAQAGSDLTDDSLREIARRLELYSGADISNLVKNVLNLPSIELQRATHFKQLNNGKWRPCAPEEPGAEERQLNDFEDDALDSRRALSFTDFLDAIETHRPTLTKEVHDVFLAEAERVGGDLATQVTQQDQQQGLKERTPREREIDTILFGTDPQQPYTATSIPDEVSKGEWWHSVAFQRFVMMCVTNPDSYASQIKARWYQLTFLFILLLAFVPVVFWALVTSLGLLTVLSTVAGPIINTILEMRNGAGLANERTLTQRTQNLAILLVLSAVVCGLGFLSITGRGIIDAIVLTWLLDHAINEASIVLAMTLFTRHRETLNRRSHVLERVHREEQRLADQQQQGRTPK